MKDTAKVLIVSVLCVMVGGAKEPGLPLGTSLATKSAKNAIQVKQKTVTFPGAKGSKLTLGKTEIAVVADAGHLCAVYDREKRKVRVFNIKGEKQREFDPLGKFARILLSNSGMVVAYGKPMTLNPSYREPLSVFAADGKALLRKDRLLTGQTFIRFSPSGDTIFILATRDAGPVPCTYIINNKGKTASGEWKVGYCSGGIKLSPNSQKVAFITYRLGDIHAGMINKSRVHIYDAAKNHWRWIECNGALLGQNQVALSDNGDELVVCGPGFVASYDTNTTNLKWRHAVVHLSTGTISVGAGVCVSIAGDKVVTAHRVPTGKSYKYLISVFDVKGNRQNLFDVSSGDSILKTNSFLTPEQPHPLGVARIWDVGKDGHSITR